MKPHISYEINDDRSRLTLQVDEATQAQLVELRDNQDALQDEYSSSTIWGTTHCEAEVLEQLVANSEFRWVDPSDTGDLTDAPILGILDSEENQSRTQSGPHGAIHIGGDAGGAWFLPILERWGYEPYQVRSFLDDLADKGQAVFQNAW